MASSEQRLHSVLTILEGCQAVLTDSADRETAHLLSVAVLQLRMKLHHIADVELKALCDAMAAAGHGYGSDCTKSPEDQRRRRSGLLKLVE